MKKKQIFWSGSILLGLTVVAWLIFEFFHSSRFLNIVFQEKPNADETSLVGAYNFETVLSAFQTVGSAELVTKEANSLIKIEGEVSRFQAPGVPYQILLMMCDDEYENCLNLHLRHDFYANRYTGRYIRNQWDQEQRDSAAMFAFDKTRLILEAFGAVGTKHRSANEIAKIWAKELVEFYEMATKHKQQFAELEANGNHVIWHSNVGVVGNIPKQLSQFAKSSEKWEKLLRYTWLYDDQVLIQVEKTADDYQIDIKAPDFTTIQGALSYLFQSQPIALVLESKTYGKSLIITNHNELLTSTQFPEQTKTSKWFQQATETELIAAFTKP